MEQANGWERLGELSRLLQSFRRMYVRRDVEEDNLSLRKWRTKLVEFLKGLLLSCEVQGTREDGAWVHFRFEGPLAKVLGHSCCDWSSPDAFRCGLMSEVLEALDQVQSELPVSTPAIVHVLLHRLAIVRPSKETKGSLLALVSALHDVLDACPAMPGVALEASIEDCLRRPSPGAAAWSLGAVRTFVGGVLSLVSRSPRSSSLCQAVVSVLVRFVAEQGCGLADDSLVLDVEEKEWQPCSLCVSCAAGDGVEVNADVQVKVTTRPQPSRCNAQEKRDLVLEGLLRWAVDIHFRQCSRLLQASLSRAVCDGIRKALDAAELSPERTSSSAPCFPDGCRLLLSFVGGLAGDGGAQAAWFLQERCGTELRSFLARARSRPFAWRTKATGSRIAVRAPVPRRPELPVLDAYVGHLCLCRHVSDALASRHLDWLARQALAVLRLLDGDGQNEPAGVSKSGDVRGALLSLSHALALLLTRPTRGDGVGRGSAGAVTEGTGNLLEIVFDSDARPLSGVPTPLAKAAIDALKEAGHLQLAQPDELFRPPPGVTKRTGSRLAPPKVAGCEPPVAASASSDGASRAEGIDFRRASVAFRSSWSLAATGLDTHLPVLGSLKRRLDSGDLSTDDGDDDSDSAAGSDDDDSLVGNGWGRVPDEVALRIFSFLTPKRVCRLACVDRAWRELLMVPRVWRPFFEARWPVTMIENDEHLAAVTDRLLLDGLGSEGRAKRKKKRRRGGVVQWPLPEDAGPARPSPDWMVLYRDRHKAERAARGRIAAKTKFGWLVCPFLGCVCSLKSEFAVKRHLQTHKKLPVGKQRAVRMKPKPAGKVGATTTVSDTRGRPP
eukprot:g9451.t1